MVAMPEVLFESAEVFQATPKPSTLFETRQQPVVGL
jgi:hypothetical protein